MEGFGVVCGDLVDPEREQPAGGSEAGGVGARQGVGVDPPAGGMEGGNEVEAVVGGEEDELVVEIDELGVRRGAQPAALAGSGASRAPLASEKRASRRRASWLRA